MEGIGLCVLLDTIVVLNTYLEWGFFFFFKLQFYVVLCVSSLRAHLLW